MLGCPRSAKFPGANKMTAASRNNPMPDVHANQRQRGVGRCPSGNNIRRNPEIPMNGTQVHSDIANPTPAPGRPFTSAYSA
jgi:hypothetical protein